MKTYRRKDNREMFDVVVPFGPGAIIGGASAALDDCPICQELKRQLAEGSIEEVEERGEGSNGNRNA